MQKLATIFIRTTSLKLNLVNFNIEEPVSMKKIVHYFKTVKFWFAKKKSCKSYTQLNLSQVLSSTEKGLCVGGEGSFEIFYHPLHFMFDFYKDLIYIDLNVCVSLQPTFFFHINAFRDEVNLLHRRKENNTASGQIFQSSKKLSIMQFSKLAQGFGQQCICQCSLL